MWHVAQVTLSVPIPGCDETTVTPAGVTLPWQSEQSNGP
jgi:hypothetical protein